MAPKNKQLSAAEKAEIMGEGFSLTHQQEAQERYGNTADWAEYQRRTATMNSADWQNGKQQAEEVEQALVEAFTRDVYKRQPLYCGIRGQIGNRTQLTGYRAIGVRRRSTATQYGGTAQT